MRDKFAATMTKPVLVRLQPLGKIIEVERGTPLQDALFGYGVEFPCGGHGRCGNCRVRILEGSLPLTPDEEAILAAAELAEGWRLACRNRAESDVTLEVKQWEATVLVDHSTFAFVPREGLGIAIDLGTTTVVGQLLDLSSGHVLAVRTGLNPQVGYGGDIMSRVEFAVARAGQRKLEELIRRGIGQIVEDLRASSDKLDAPIARIVVVGNTVMHHVFCGIDLEPLSHYPFEPVEDGLQRSRASDLGWNIAGDPVVLFLPCLGGFVGSDILAGILAAKIHLSEALLGLVDLGTNGEVVIGNRERILCASTAAGPAFEGARIRMGMQASTGAISEVEIYEGRPRCRVLGNVPPRGICGSGLVDAVAVGLELGLIHRSGKFADGIVEWVLKPPVKLFQNDIRELQLAKGAVAAAMRILLRSWGAQASDVERLFLAGAFGNYINRTSARRIGLIQFPEGKVWPAGNTALLGAKIELFDEDPDSNLVSIRDRVEHIPVAADPHFEDIYVESMTFS